MSGTLKQTLLALISHPVVPGVLYAGAFSGVYKTTNGGTSWSLASGGLPPNPHIKSLALNPLKPDTVFAGTDSLGMYVSLSGGSSWSHVGAGITSGLIREVICSPATSGVVYAGTDSGVFRSANNGATWSPNNSGLPLAASVRAIACDALHPNIWFVGVWQAGVFWSADAGASWRPFSYGLGSTNVSALAVDAPNATVYAGTEAGTWQYSNYPLSYVAVDAVEPVRPSFHSWPNPFRDSAVIQFVNERAERVDLEVFDLAGRRVRRLLAHSPTPAGSSSVAWDGRDERGWIVAGGVYLARLNRVEGAQYLRLARVR